jgi:hypothetical protein
MKITSHSVMSTGDKSIDGIFCLIFCEKIDPTLSHIYSNFYVECLFFSHEIRLTGDFRLGVILLTSG